MPQPTTADRNKRKDRRSTAEIAREMVGTESWGEAVTRNRWVRSETYGEDYDRYLVSAQSRIDDLLKELGLA